MAGLDPLPAVPAGLLLVDDLCRGAPMLDQLEGLADVVPWLRSMRSAADEAGGAAPGR